jgi:hypothetical protein
MQEEEGEVMHCERLRGDPIRSLKSSEKKVMCK